MVTAAKSKVMNEIASNQGDCLFASEAKGHMFESCRAHQKPQQSSTFHASPDVVNVCQNKANYPITRTKDGQDDYEQFLRFCAAREEHYWIATAQWDDVVDAIVKEGYLAHGSPCPDDHEYTFHNPRHVGRWMSVDDNWRCPGCSRTKRQIMHREWKTGRWIGDLVLHHDHGSDYGLTTRFPPTIICNECNLVDAACKFGRKDFSLSPAEIRSIVTAYENRGHQIDTERGRQIMRSVRGGKQPQAHLRWSPVQISG